MNNIVARVAGHIELDELPLAAGSFECRKVFPTVVNQVINVTLTIEPSVPITRLLNKAFLRVSELGAFGSTPDAAFPGVSSGRL